MGTDLKVLAEAAQVAKIVLVAATDGNHGRAVARVASILGLQSRVLVPKSLDTQTVKLIRDEGAEVTITDEDYDATVAMAKAVSENTAAGVLIQDTAFDGYEVIPQWIVDGYSTMMGEIETQLDGQHPDLIVTPVGVGSLAQAVVSYSKATGRGTQVLSVEADTAACLWKSLSCGSPVSVKTGRTILSGMNCGTVSRNSWPILKDGIDASVTVSDAEAHEAVRELSSLGVKAGPCGAATLAALRYVIAPGSLSLTKDSTVVLLSTEGIREYNIPLDVRTSDSVELTQALVRIDSTNPGLSRSGGIGEGPIAEYISAWLEHRGIETHRLEETPTRPSVVGIVRGSGGGKSILLTGHIDTVTTAGYEGDPLSGDIKDGLVYGRRTADMKAGIAAALIGLARAKGANLRGDVIFAGVADEENLSLGTEEVLKAGWKADGAIVLEPTLLDVVLAHKGFVWFEVDIHGFAAHGSRYDLGVDAICKAGHFLVELDSYSKDILKREGHPELGTGSVHASLVQGGEEPSSYPAKCTITIERRTVPGETSESTAAQPRSILDRLVATVEDFKYDLRISFVRPPFQISESDPFVACAIGGIGEALERPAKIKTEKAWTDCALLAEAGIPSLLFGVDGGGLHASIEWATLDSIQTVTKAVSLVVEMFCA
ncbi:related to diaminopropionate ammonia-lyase [Phialocephala subalpina]|uniref:Related to diaminopropionate ammonia-lyase n=1 Tax=Phialocephala subalpina TaxID=576137 RepID=A0A1L7X360_9HELO|nr:related to diaminopropionate ammonia-lyase [Phialocephala subalpina]